MSKLSEFETKMVGILESGIEPGIDDFVSLDELLKQSDVLGKSPLLTEFIRLVCKPSTPSDENTAECWKFVEESLPHCKNASALTEIVDLVDLAPIECAERMFQIFAISFADSRNSPACRIASLDGAVRYAIRKPTLRFELISNVLKLKIDEDRHLVRSVAKILGVLHANWPETELFDKLIELASNPDVLDQVAFELGVSKIQSALNSIDVKSIEREFHDSKYWFERSLAANTDRHDSAIYLECVICLLDFYRGRVIDAKAVSSRIRKHVAFLKAWNRSSANPPWMQSETVQLFYWETLGDRLSRLSEEILKPSWYEAATVIETFLVSVWSASTNLLMRNAKTGIEAIVRPRIEGQIGVTSGQAFALKEWLRRNEHHNDFETATELSERVDAIIKESQPNNPTTGHSLDPSLEKAINESGIVGKQSAIQAIRDSQRLSLRNLTIQQEAIIDECIKFVENHPDYQNEVYRELYNAILLWTVRFLHTRLEMTKGDEPAMKYLFKQENGKKPLEAELQTDYKNVMISTIGGTDVEVTNVAGGRADVLFSLTTERIITEVKREERDCSFASLISEYSAQAADYQNVSGRLGFVLVLDQTKQDTGTPHISSLIKPTKLLRTGESTPRMLVFVKVPGERLTPSMLTKTAKKQGAQDRRDQKKKTSN